MSPDHRHLNSLQSFVLANNVAIHMPFNIFILRTDLRSGISASKGKRIFVSYCSLSFYGVSFCITTNSVMRMTVSP